MTKSYSYIRMSTLQQAKGASLSRQLEATRKFAEKQGWELVTSLHDIGVSAFRGKNANEGALNQFIVACEQGRVEKGSFLIVEDLDRISRQELFPAIDLFFRILRNGIGIVTLVDGQIYTTDGVNKDPYQIYMSIGHLTRAHQESELKSIRVSDAWRKKREAIREKPYTRRAPAWLEATGSVKSKIKFVPIPERVKIVRKIFDLMDKGMGNYAIAQRLNQDGVPTFGKGKAWGNSTIQKMAENEAVLGNFQPHDKQNGRRQPSGPQIVGHYPRIIDDDLFYRVKLARERRRTGRSGPKGSSFNNIFVGLVRCEKCGSTMGYENKGAPPKGGQYLHCRGSKRGICSNRYHYVYKHIEEDIIGLVSKLDFSKVFPEKDSSPETITQQISSQQTAIETLRRKRKRLLKTFSDNEDEDVRAIIDEYQNDIWVLQESLKHLKKQQASEKSEEARSTDRVFNIRRLKNEFVDANVEDLYQLRAAMCDEIATVIDHIIFSDHGDFVVHLAGSENTILFSYGETNGPKNVEFQFGEDGAVTGLKELPYHHVWLDEN